jgi:hypothetical protein
MKGSGQTAAGVGLSVAVWGSWRHDHGNCRFPSGDESMTAKKAAPKKRTVNKSADTGRFVKGSTMKKSPKTTYKQTVSRKKAK